MYIVEYTLNGVRHMLIGETYRACIQHKEELEVEHGVIHGYTIRSCELIEEKDCKTKEDQDNL